MTSPYAADRDAPAEEPLCTPQGFQQHHEPIGFDGDLPLDCTVCGQAWPCEAAKSTAWRLNTLMDAIRASRPGDFVPLSVRHEAAKAAEAIVARHFDRCDHRTDGLHTYPSGPNGAGFHPNQCLDCGHWKGPQT